VVVYAGIKNRRQRLPDWVSIGRRAGFHLADTVPISRQCEPRLRVPTDQPHISTSRPGTLEKCLKNDDQFGLTGVMQPIDRDR
jgi:hypothetical protein